jgi:hypothetical protein
MTRIDLTTREWHGLIAPVIPHASDDKELPELCAVRIEVAGQVVFAVASDRYTMGASRHVLDERAGADCVIHIDRVEAATMLRLFPFTKDSNPQLKVIIDKVPVPAGRHVTVDALGLTVESEDGTRLLLHDHRDPLQPGFLAGWRKHLGRVIFRDLAPASPSLLITPSCLGRWAKAVRPGERVVFLAGPGPTDPILMLVEEHFAGILQPAGHLDTGTNELLTASPWRGELSGELADVSE